MIKLLKYIMVISTVLITAGCNVAESKTTSTTTNIIDFGDPNVKQLSTRLATLSKSKNVNQVVKITQFGDSHTAADFFTGELRTLLQQKYGNAGIGWVTPLAVKGQHHTAVKWNSAHWTLFSSRTVNDMDFPMGGFIAKPTQNNATIQITPNSDNNKLWQIKLTFKALKNSATSLNIYDANNRKVDISYNARKNSWQTVSANVTMPIMIKSSGDIELGGVWLSRDQQSGIIVSAIATNGAKQSIWQKWNGDWFKELATSKSDLIILEYGANESFDKTLDLDEYRNNLISNIRHIRKTLPKAVILLMSPPDTMINDHQAPSTFQAIKAIQKQVAKSEKTLLWDWQKAMGGEFIIKKWMQQGLARSDLVHQTQQGYKESASLFYTDFIDFFEKRR